MSEIDKIIERCVADNPPYCQAACLLHIDVKGYVGLLKEGKYGEALKLIKDKLPFPGIMGRVCTHPCENKCKRVEVDEPIACAALKRAATDHAEGIREDLTIAEEKDKRIAIVGGGPAGLMAAHDLRKMGYQVTIFEALPVLGGMLVVGIPEFRLPRHIVQTELSLIQKLGIEVKLNTKVDTKVKFSDLRRGFDVIFLAIGAHKGRKLGIENEESEGVVDGVEFLRSVNLGEKVEPKDKVVIVGGGNVAIDCARTCLRLGFKDVTILYRRSRVQMPAVEEVAEAEREGVKIKFLAAPVKVLTKDDKVIGTECIRIRLGKPDTSARRSPIPIRGSEFVIGTDMLISAIGEQPDLSFLREEEGSLFTKEELLQVNPVTLETRAPGIFAGGDAVTGPASIIDALAAGRKAAISIDRYIKGEDLTVGREGEGLQESKLVMKIEGIHKKERIGLPSLSLGQRKKSFREVKLGFSKEETKEEAERCLQCECKLCVKDCEFLSSYCGTPKELAEKFKTGYFRGEPVVPYSCNNCTLCQKLCPVELNVGKMCMELREELVKEGLGPLPRHRFVKVNQDFSTSDSFVLAKPNAANNKCKRVFFPGCTLSGYSPSLVIKTYDYLQQKLPGTGIVLGCCGEQTLCLGDKVRFRAVLEGTVGMFKQLGISEVIVACPLCYKTFKEHASELSLTFLSDAFLKVGLPGEAEGNGQTFSLHDSCSARWENGVQDSVRALVKEMGYQIEELEYSRQKTRCCGLGGMVPFVDLELAGKITKRRIEEAPHDLLTYCASCREVFAAYKPTVHILDLIFNPNWERDKLEPPKTGRARRENQAKVKTLMQEMFARS